MQRRDFLKLTAATLALGPARLIAAPGKPLLLSCRANRGDQFYLSAVTAEGQLHFDIPLPARGHGISVHPDQTSCVVFARRPGDFMLAINLGDGQVTHRVKATTGRCYYGHGAYDSAGRLLYVTENDFEAGRGVIGIYDAADGYRRLGEVPSHGVGPHELVMLNDGRTLAVANGGIRTHPDMGRAKLNLPDMDPNLSYVESNSGALLGQYRPPAQWHQLSIRHLDATADNTVCVGMQYQGPKSHRPPLVALHRGDDQLQLVTAPDAIQTRMKNYCGSVTCNNGSSAFAISSPRGGIVTRWSADDGRYLGHAEVFDGCGIAAGNGPDDVLVSDGRGAIQRLSQLDQLSAFADLGPRGVRWDNHMVTTRG